MGGPVTVDYSTADGTAVAGQDYTATHGTLVFQPGETSKTVTISILNDTVVEGPETLTLGLANPTAGAHLGSPSSVTLTITDDDSGPPPPPPPPPPGSTPHVIVTGAGAGGGPHVKIFDVATQSVKLSFFAYAPTFLGGVRVAVGDVTGDGIPDLVTAPGPGGGPHIKVFDGATGALVRQFFAYAPSFTGGVWVAVGDVNGDGKADVITGAGPGGGPHVKVFDGATGAVLKSFFAYAPSFTGGVSVAVGDVDGDGKADVITGAGPGGGPHVRAFSGATGGLLYQFFAYSPVFTGGVTVAAGDVNGDGKADVITGPGAGGSPLVKVFSGANGAMLESFLAFDPSFPGGVRVGARDLNGDGHADILAGAGPGPGPYVRVLDGASLTELDRFVAYDPTFTGGIFVAAG
jgi:hypothetical protein